MPLLLDKLREIPVETIHQGRYQPRTCFDPDRLIALEDSIEQVGIRQRLLVREIGSGAYELVSGERRWRCAQNLGLDRVPVVVRTYDDEKQVALDAGAENSQRDDLDLMERATYAKALREEHDATNEEIAASLEVAGADASNVTHLVNLLELPEIVQDYLRQGSLAMGHGKVLRRIKGSPALQVLVARAAVKRDWTVRMIESAVRAVRGSVDSSPQEQKKALNRFLKGSARKPREFGEHYEQMARVFTEQLSYRVTFKSDPENWRKGCLQIHYGNQDELDGILAKISGIDPSVL